MTLPLVACCSGKRLTEEERRVFTKYKPQGFIIFECNVEDRQQLAALIQDLKSCVGGDDDVLIMIDQEGGCKQRLWPPEWPERHYSNLFIAQLAATNMEAAKELAYLKGRVTAEEELAPVGINTNCAPVIDLPRPETAKFLPERTFGYDKEIVKVLSEEYARGLAEGGVVPIAKHLPGHGRATTDTHYAVAVVNADLKTLRDTDFEVVENASKGHCGYFGMTAHVKYVKIDPANTATTSPTVVQLIRNELGYGDALLITDALEMDGLEGDLSERAVKALEAGCDLALLCHADEEGYLDRFIAMAEALMPFANKKTEAKVSAVLRKMENIAASSEPFSEAMLERYRSMLPLLEPYEAAHKAKCDAAALTSAKSNSLDAPQTAV
jgi:beta-N-acetylhexosaminidase